jgi:lysophospholipase L1-like esterase
VAGGGETLAGHVDSTETAASLASRSWDIVVLQEQSEIPAVTAWRQQEMTPAARALVGRVRAIGATPVLFETWGHRDGLPDSGLPGYDAMQTALNRGYTEVATELDVPLAPVGRAWSAAIRLDPNLELWQGDGSHPTAQGTYLAAAVFYAELFGTDPAAVVGVPGGPSVSDARELAGAAQAVVAEGPPLQLR